MEEAALMCSFLSAHEKRAKIFELIFVKVSAGKFELPLFECAHHDVLKFHGVFPWANSVRVNVE